MKPSVVLAMPTTRDLPYQTALSLLQTQMACFERDIPVMFFVVAGDSLVHHARNACAVRFLETHYSHLFWIDSDMAWQAEDFVRLLALCTEHDIVCASYRVKDDTIDFRVSMKDPDEPVSTNEFGLIEINGAGLGFCCMSRKVVETIANNAPRLIYDKARGPEPALFDCLPRNGFARGEDTRFFDKARELGFTAWMDPKVTLGHVGPKVYEGAFVDQIKRL
jgi:hypothetical protein